MIRMWNGGACYQNQHAAVKSKLGVIQPKKKDRLCIFMKQPANLWENMVE